VKAARAAFVGKIFDAAGQPMRSTFAYSKAKRIYRYYCSTPSDPVAVDDELTAQRVSAPLLESHIAASLQRILARPILVGGLPAIVARVEMRKQIEIVFSPDASSNPELAYADMSKRLEADELMVWEDRAKDLCRLRLAITSRLRGGRSWLDGRQDRPGTTRTNSGLIHALQDAHEHLMTCGASPLSNCEAMMNARSPDLPHQRQLSRLAFLAPDLQRQILDGEQPSCIKLRTLLKSELPLLWSDQRHWFEQMRLASA